MLRILVCSLIVVAFLAGCSFKLGAKELNAEAKTARKEQSLPSRENVSAMRFDKALVQSVVV